MTESTPFHERAASLRPREASMNKYERGGGEAVVEYLDSNLKVIRPGAFVRCAVTGQPIPFDELRYWSVERQEPYASPEAVLKRLGLQLRPGGPKA